jgi:gamma-glutamylcyclotransferase
MAQDSIITFAYGSNMPTARLRERCPSAQPLGVAELRGYELRWHKISRKDGSGKCDIVRTDRPGAAVFGVLYKIAASEGADLDSAEGLGFGYDEAEIEVCHDGDQRTVTAYVATATDPALKPYSWYRALVVAGAKEHGLPTDYIAKLEAVLAEEDQDQERHGKNMAIIGGVRP